MLDANEFSIDLFSRGIRNAQGLLSKAEAYALSSQRSEDEVLSARLADDMHDLATQLHWTGESARMTLGRLQHTEPTPQTDVARSFAGLHLHLTGVLAFLESVDSHSLREGLKRTVEVPILGQRVTFSGSGFLATFAIPHFYFHLTSAYAILRQEGVSLRMSDFLGA